jgi:hypothetical protein
MHPGFVTRGAAASIPVWFVTGTTWSDIRARLDARASAFAAAAGFEPLPGRHAFLPGPDGNLAAVLFGLEDAGKPINPFLPGTLAGVLPRGIYRFANAPHDPRLAALAIALGAYRFVRYGKPANEVSTALSSRAPSRPSISRATSSTRRQTTWDRARSPMPPPRSPAAMARART